MLHTFIYNFKQSLELFPALPQKIRWALHENEEQNKKFDWQHSLYIIHIMLLKHSERRFCTHRCLIFLRVLYGVHMCLLIIDSYTIKYMLLTPPFAQPLPRWAFRAQIYSPKRLPAARTTHTNTNTHFPPSSAVTCQLNQMSPHNWLMWAPTKAKTLLHTHTSRRRCTPPHIPASSSLSEPKQASYATNNNSVSHRQLFKPVLLPNINERER